MWSRGAEILLRYVERGRVVAALPVRVVVDGGVATVLHLVGGSTIAWPAVDGRPLREVPLEERFAAQWGARERTWEGHGLTIVSRETAACAIWLFPGRWYVNLEEPWRRTQLGFDTRDHTLDIWVEQDGSWSWKDEEELEAAVRFGRHLPEEASAIRAEGERVLAEWPFPTGWEDWLPPDDWEPAALPAGWDAL